jgi:hypothetical protein
MNSLKVLDMLAEIEEFLSGSVRNAWLHTPGFDLYIRKGQHLIGDKILHCLDIANINIEPQRQGVFKLFIQDVEKICPYKIIYLESVINKYLMQFMFKQQDWQLHNEFNFYKVLR